MGRYFKTLLSLAIVITVLGGVPKASASFPPISAGAAVVYDAASNRFIYKKNADTKLSIASITKIMTAIVAIEHLDVGQEVVIGREHMSHGSSMYLKLGEKVTVEELLYGLMLMSGNDAALALASCAEGGLDGFVVLMNQKAKQLGMRNSSFSNPNGLDGEAHFSTAADMAVLTAYAMENPLFRQIVSTKSADVAGRYMTNHNRLLNTISGATGVKTGYTSKAGRCLVSSVMRDGREIIVVTINAPNDWEDHTTLYKRAFDDYKPVEVIRTDEPLVEIPLVAGEAMAIPVYAREEFKVAVTEGETVDTVIYLPRLVFAPVRAGERAGEVAVVLDGNQIARIGLYYSQGYGVTEPPLSSFERISLFFKNIVK